MGKQREASEEHVGGHSRRISLAGYTYVVKTGTDGNSEGDDGANGTTDSSRGFGLDAEVGVSDTGGEQGGVGGVDERSGGTVEFSKEDEEEGKGSGFGEVAVGTDSTLKLGNLGGAVDLLVTRTVHLVRIAGAKVNVGVESVDDDVGRKVRVVASKEGRVCQRGLHRRQTYTWEGARLEKRGKINTRLLGKAQTTEARNLRG